MHARSTLRLVSCFLLCFFVLAAYGCGSGSGNRRTDRNDDSQLSESVSEATVPASSGPTTPLKFKKGQNNYTMTVDGLKREFIVHVPSGYKPDTPVPLVFVFHMGAHNGAYAYATTKWQEQCDKETCISVYPTAMKYFVVKENANQTTWNDVTAVGRVPPSTPLADDVKFVQKMVETLEATFNIDTKRIYASGASNGGMFVSSRILIELPDIFAAAGINLVLATTGLTPKNNEAIPSFVTYGNRDPLVLELLQEKGLADEELPMEAGQIMQHPLLGVLISNALKTLGLDPSYTVEYCAPKLNRCTGTYSPSLDLAEGLYTTLTFAKGGKSGVELRFRMIKGMGHAYATAGNNPARLLAAEYEWEFFKEHPKP